MAHTEIDLTITGIENACTVTAITADASVSGAANLSVAAYLHAAQSRAAPDHGAIEALGRALFLALPDDIQELVRRRTPASDLHLRLDIQSMALATLPWEYMHDGQSFLALAPGVVLARRLDGEPLGQDGGTLRVLVVIPALEGDEERRKAEKGRLTARLAQAGVRVDFLDERGGRSSLAAIQRELRRSRSTGDPYHVLHLACPLEDDDTQLPYLILENEEGGRQRAVVDQLKWCAAEHRLRLVVFGGLAPARPPAVATTLPAAAELAQVCAEAVIVPRFPMEADALTLFSAELYLAMADGYAVDHAAVEARRALIREAGEQSAGWASPVLFLREPAQRVQATGADAAAAAGGAPLPERAVAGIVTQPGDVPPPVEETEHWWNTIPIELWIALLGAATTILVALIPILADFAKQEAPESRSAAVVAETPAATPTALPSLAAYDVGAIVAGFQLPEGGDVDPADADLQIERFYLQLQSELEESMRPLRFRAGLLGPDVVGRIEGKTPDEREQQATQLAQTYAADLVVYGVMTYDDLTSQLRIQPEYYVVPDSFGDALEMTGAFRFGSPIGVSMPINRGLGVERELSARAASLAQVMVGLSLFLLEHDYQGALTAFEAAAKLPGWEKMEGREVVDLLIGNTQLALAVDAAAACDREGVLARLDEALLHFDSAAQQAPSYARAYAGKASAHYLASVWAPAASANCQFESIDPASLQLAAADIAAAQQASEQPKEIGVRSRMLLTEAQIGFMEWWTTAADPTLDALKQQPFWSTTEKVIANYENGDNASVGQVASDARLLRGQGLFALGDCWSAQDEFDAALAIAEMTPERRMDVWSLKGDCFVELQQTSAASDAYNQALQIARQLGSADDIAYFEAARRQLSAPATP